MKASNKEHPMLVKVASVILMEHKRLLTRLMVHIIRSLILMISMIGTTN